MNFGVTKFRRISSGPIGLGASPGKASAAPVYTLAKPALVQQSDPAAPLQAQSSNERSAAKRLSVVPIMALTCTCVRVAC